MNSYQSMLITGIMLCAHTGLSKLSKLADWHQELQGVKGTSITDATQIASHSMDSFHLGHTDFCVFYVTWNRESEGLNFMPIRERIWHFCIIM